MTGAKHASTCLLTVEGLRFNIDDAKGSGRMQRRRAMIGGKALVHTEATMPTDVSKSQLTRATSGQAAGGRAKYNNAEHATEVLAVTGY